MKKSRIKTGFALMTPEKQKELAKIGGKSVPKEKRTFSTNRELASRAGKAGGKSVAPDKRTFASDRSLASRAGRLGGLRAQARKVAIDRHIREMKKRT